MRLSPLLTTLLLGACTISSTGGEPASVECTTGADGEMVCTQTGEDEDRPEGDSDGDQPGDGGDPVTCSSEECTIHCEEGGTNEDGSTSNARHCVIECENGLRCDQVCNGESCALYCTCPDAGGAEPDPGCDGNTMDGCQEPDPCGDNTDSEDCQPDDWCSMNPDSTECQEDGEQDPGDGCENAEDPDCCTHDSTEEHEAYCQEHPDSPEC